MVSTLYRLSELRDSSFGQPDPRHGLRLLWWFANECVQIDFNGCIHALCDPTKGDFGFHRFRNGDQLLPYTNHPYYKTGNLNHPDHSLPYYVTENFTGYSDASNTDRIIVSLLTDWNGHLRFHEIYVTQHSDQTHFDMSRTYRISPGLMKDIRNLTQAKFLRQMENDQNQIYYNQQCTKLQYNPPPTRPIQNLTHEQQRSGLSIKDICKTFCTVLAVFALLILFCTFVRFAK